MAHWLLVALFGFSWWTAANDAMRWHRFSGYAILAIVLFRIYWGFLGTRTARFDQFVRGPVAVANYLRSMGRRSTVWAVGHNPLGGWSVMLLLAALLLQTLLGLFAVDVDGIESGPLSYWVSFEAGRWAAKLHGRGFVLLKALVVIHLAAILFYQVYKRQNLIAAMIVGTRRLPPSAWRSEHLEPPPTVVRRAIIGLVVVTLLVIAVAKGFQW
jgi:cytochrome b